MTKSQTIEALAEKTGLPKTQISTIFEELGKLAYANAKDNFEIPGFGKLVLVSRQARTGRNPATGATIQIPAKTVVKFRISKACKDGVLAQK